MQAKSVRRLIAGVAVAGAVIAAGVTAGSADAATGDVAVFLRDTTTPAGGSGTPLEPIWSTTSPTELELAEPSITYELSAGLTGVSLIEPDPESGGLNDCVSESATRIVCSDWVPLYVGPEGSTGLLGARVQAGSSAQAGATGTITATFTATGVAPITATAKVQVAQSVDLQAGDTVALSAAPNSVVGLPLTVRNAGATAISGAAVTFDSDYEMAAQTRYSNCLYAGDRIRSCTFDQTLAVGSAYHAFMPMRVRPDAYAPGFAYNGLDWRTPAELADEQAYLAHRNIDFGTPGDGGVLALTVMPAKQSTPQADVFTDNNYGAVEITVTGTNGTDLVAVGSAVTGAAGATVDAAVAVRNDGPATLDFGRSGEPVAAVYFSVPSGTTVVTAPTDCERIGGQYQCYGKNLLPVGASETYTFKLRIDTVVSDANGAIVVNPPCECSRFRNDTNVANNTAAVVVNPRAPGTARAPVRGGVRVPGPAKTPVHR
jgi:hypothetical protein